MLQGSTVMVTGGTGYIGSRLVRMLIARGSHVRALAREPKRIPSDLRSTVEWVRGDVADPRAVREVLQGASYVFHLAGTFRDPSADEAEHRRVHVQGSQVVAEAAAELPALSRFVHISTIGVHGHIASPPADEEYPYAPGDAYQRTKLEAELWVREFARRRPLPLTVIRPASVMGPGDERLLKLFKFARRGWFPLLGGHNTLLHLIHVDDLANCMCLAAEHPAALGEVFICGNERNTSSVEILCHIGRRMNRKVRFVHLPAAPLFLAADVNEWIAHRLGVQPILYRRRMAFFTKDRAFDTTKVRQVLGFECQFGNELALDDTLRDYRAAGWI